MAPSTFPEGGFAEGGLRGWLAFAACGAGFISRRERWIGRVWWSSPLAGLLAEGCEDCVPRNQVGLMD